MTYVAVVARYPNATRAVVSYMDLEAALLSVRYQLEEPRRVKSVTLRPVTEAEYVRNTTSE